MAKKGKPDAPDRDASAERVSIPVPVAAGLVAAVDQAANVTTDLAVARDAVLHAFADAGLNRRGEPVAEDGADTIGGYGTEADSDPA
jgi:hypothetical protein